MKEVVETTVSTPVTSEPKVASPVVSIEDITPRPKRMHAIDKGKGKANWNVWDNAATALGRAHNVITSEELKGLFAIPSHELVNCHIHNLVQVIVGCHLFLLKFYLCFSSFFFVLTSSLFYQVLGETIHITTEYLTNEEKVVMANSKVDVLEAKTSKLRKEMIMTMDNRNQMKEQIKALIDDLKAENLLPEQKDEQL